MLLDRSSVFSTAVTVLGGLLAARGAVADTVAVPPAIAQQGSELGTVELTIIIKSMIVALNHANRTGNYSVLRDLGTPVFRERYSQAQLTEIFAKLRNRAVNLDPAIILSPNLDRQPQFDETGRLHLEGEFPTQPLQIRFNLIVQRIDGVWRLDGIAVDATETGNGPRASQAPASAASTRR